MKILTNQLKYWIKELPEDIKIIENAFTSLAFEVEDVYKANVIEGVKVGRTSSCIKHPNADKLSYCKISLEDGIEFDVVCGGKNIKSNQYVPWAVPGSVVGGIKLEKKELRGIESNGMVLSINEIGGFSKDLLPEDEKHNIVVFDDIDNFNIDISKHLTLDGFVIDLSILPDRQYASNMQTLAYELATFLDLEIKELPKSRALFDGDVKIDINLEENATGIAATKIEISNGYTPQWVRSMLLHSGIKVENSLIDVINYFNIITGNPTYILNSDEITLKNNFLNEINILEDEPIIKDGYLVSISSSYKTNPLLIKKLNNNFGIKNTRGTTNRFLVNNLELIIEYGQKFGYIKKASKIYHQLKEKENFIEIDKNFIKKFIGFELDLNNVYKKLSKLGFEFIDNKVKIPSYRSDIKDIQDLIEEIIRFYGINNIKSVPDNDSFTTKKEFHKEQFLENSKYLMNHGFTEIKTYQLLNEKTANKYNFWEIEKIIKIKKEFGVEYNSLQTSLFDGLISVYKFNYRKERNNASAFFEIQNVYHNVEKPHQHLGIIIDENYSTQNEKTLILKKIAEDLIGEKIEFKELNIEVFNEYNSSKIFKDGKFIGIIGEIHPRILRENKFIRIDKVKTKLFYLEIDMELLK